MKGRRAHRVPERRLRAGSLIFPAPSPAICPIRRGFPPRTGPARFADLSRADAGDLPDSARVSSANRPGPPRFADLSRADAGHLPDSARV
jgi:hypothetical protein